LSNRVLMGQNMSLEDCQTSCNNDENCKGIEHWVGGTMSCYRCRVPHQTILRHPNDSPLIEVPSVYVKVPLNAVTLDNCVKGLRVHRGRDWFHGKQDYGRYFGTPSEGTIRNCKNNEWADVRFPGINNTYPIGAGGIYALNIPKDQKITKRYSFAEMALVPLVLGALALG